MKVLLDTNIVLDVALDREPFDEPARRLMAASESGAFQLFITASVVTDIYYLVRKARDRHTALTFVKDLLAFVDVCGVDKTILLASANSGFADFEDAVQNFAATSRGIDVIATRNERDYALSTAKVMSAAELIERYG